MELNKQEYENTTKLLDEAYKNVRMASFAIDCIMEKIENPNLADLLRKQNKFYKTPHITEWVHFSARNFYI